MMKRLQRSPAVLLAACLVADPAAASVFAESFAHPAPPAASLQTQRRFNQEALNALALDFSANHRFRIRAPLVGPVLKRFAAKPGVQPAGVKNPALTSLFQNLRRLFQTSFPDIFVEGVREYFRANKTGDYPALEGNKGLLDALAPYLSRELGVKLDLKQNQVMVTSGKAGLDQLISLVADIENADLKRPEERDSVWISPSLFPNYREAAGVNTRAEAAPAEVHEIIGALGRKARRGEPLPKVLFLDFSDLQADIADIMALLAIAAETRMLIVFDGTRPHPDAVKLMALLRAFPGLKGFAALLWDLEERFQLPDTRIGALVTFNSAIPGPYRTWVAATSAGKNAVTQAGLAAVIKHELLTQGRPSEDLPGLDSIPVKNILSKTALETPADPIVAITPLNLIKEYGLPYPLRKDLAELGLDDKDPEVVDLVEKVAGEKRLVITRKDFGAWAKEKNRRPPERGWRDVTILIRMWVGAPGFEFDSLVPEAAVTGARLDALGAEAIRRMARESDIDYYRRSHGMVYTLDQVISDAEGSKNALIALVKSIVRYNGVKTAVFIPRPFYDGHYSALRRAGLPDECIIPFDTKEENGYNATREELEKAARDHGYDSPNLGKILLATSPNNPTGTVMKVGQLRELMEHAAEKGYSLILDAAYEGLVPPGAALRPQEAAEQAAQKSEEKLNAILNRFSFLGTDSEQAIHPHTRRGKLAGHDVDILRGAREVLVSRSDKIANRVAWAMYRAKNAERFQDFLRRHQAFLARNRNLLYRALELVGIPVPRGDSAFYALFDTSPFHNKTFRGQTLTADNFERHHFLGTGVGGVKGGLFQGEGYRYAYSSDPKNVRRAIARLRQFKRAVDRENAGPAPALRPALKRDPSPLMSVLLIAGLASALAYGVAHPAHAQAPPNALASFLLMPWLARRVTAWGTAPSRKKSSAFLRSLRLLAQAA